MIKGELGNSPTINKYRDTVKRCIRMYYPSSANLDLDSAIDYSIQKRYRSSKANVHDSYKNVQYPDKTLLSISDYILRREPIVTAFGTMFKRKEEEPNPLAIVVQSFLDNRSKHKKIMFKYPKGSEQFEKYNLLQALTKNV